MTVSTPVTASIVPSVTSTAATTTASVPQPQVPKLMIKLAKPMTSIIAMQSTTPAMVTTAAATTDVTSQTVSATDTQTRQTHSQQQQQQQPDPQPTTAPDTPSHCTRAQTALPDELQPSTTKTKKDSTKSKA